MVRVKKEGPRKKGGRKRREKGLSPGCPHTPSHTYHSRNHTHSPPPPPPPPPGHPVTPTTPTYHTVTQTHSQSHPPHCQPPPPPHFQSHPHTTSHTQFYVKRRSGRTCIYEKPACCSRVQLRKACFTYVRQNDKAHAHQITLLSLAP